MPWRMRRPVPGSRKRSCDPLVNTLIFRKKDKVLINYGNNIGDGTCMNLITATRLPLNSRGSEDLRTRCCKNHPTLNGLPINIDGAHFQRACLLSLHSPQVVDLRLLSVDAFSVMCQLQYHYKKNKRCNSMLHRLFVITWHSLPNSSSVPPHTLRRLSGPWE